MAPSDLMPLSLKSSPRKTNATIQSFTCKEVSQSIVDLQIGHNNIGSEGASELAEGLMYAKTLQKLDIQSNSSGNRITSGRD